MTRTAHAAACGLIVAVFLAISGAGAFLFTRKAGSIYGLRSERLLAQGIFRGYSYPLSVVSEGFERTRQRCDIEVCSTDTVSIVAALSLRRIELRWGSPRSEIDLDEALQDLGSATRVLLRRRPTDSFLWLLLYWQLNTTEGFSKAHLPLLSRSYDTGAFETWIARKRSPLAAAVLRNQDFDNRASALLELMALLKMQQYDIGARVLASIPSTYIDAIRPALLGLPEREIALLSRYMERNDLPQPEVLQQPARRPAWER